MQEVTVARCAFFALYPFHSSSLLKHALGVLSAYEFFPLFSPLFAFLFEYPMYACLLAD